MKIKKVIAILIVCWGILFCFDFFQLKDSHSIEGKPFITLQSKRTKKEQIYRSIGYSIHYELKDNGIDVGGMEIRFFAIPIYAWVE